MITDESAVVSTPAAVPDIVLDARTGSLTNTDLTSVDLSVDLSSVDEVDTVDEEFFALIYSDEQLLRDEFEALMAAAWSEPPTPARRRVGEPPPDRPGSALPSLGGRLPVSVDAGRRALGALTRAPPDRTAARHRIENERRARLP